MALTAVRAPMALARTKTVRSKKPKHAEDKVVASKVTKSCRRANTTKQAACTGGDRKHHRLQCGHLVQVFHGPQGAMQRSPCRSNCRRSAYKTDDKHDKFICYICLRSIVFKQMPRMLEQTYEDLIDANPKTSEWTVEHWLKYFQKSRVVKKRVAELIMLARAEGERMANASEGVLAIPARAKKDTEEDIETELDDMLASFMSFGIVSDDNHDVVMEDVDGEGSEMAKSKTKTLRTLVEELVAGRDRKKEA